MIYDKRIGILCKWRSWNNPCKAECFVMYIGRLRYFLHKWMLQNDTIMKAKYELKRFIFLTGENSIRLQRNSTSIPRGNLPTPFSSATPTYYWIPVSSHLIPTNICTCIILTYIPDNVAIPVIFGRSGSAQFVSDFKWKIGNEIGPVCVLDWEHNGYSSGFVSMSIALAHLYFSHVFILIAFFHLAIQGLVTRADIFIIPKFIRNTFLKKHNGESMNYVHTCNDDKYILTIPSLKIAFNEH